MTIINRSATLVLFLFSSLTLFAQVNDAGLWISLGAKKEITKKINLSAENELRFNENITELRTAFVDLSGDFKVNDFIKLGINYRFGNRKQENNTMQLRQRWAFDLMLKTKVKELAIEYRSRFQQSIESISAGEFDIEFNRTFRNKISFEHKVYKKTDADISAEIFSSKKDGVHRLSDVRLTTGLSYKLKKRKIIKLGYLLQTELQQANPARDFVIVIGYKYEFK